MTGLPGGGNPDWRTPAASNLLANPLRHGYHSVMQPITGPASAPKLLTVAQAAKKLRMSVSLVTDLCAKHGIGIPVNARMRLLSAADLERLKTCRDPKEGGRPQSSR